MTPEQFHAWVLEQAAAVKHTPTAAPPGVALDIPHNVERGRAWLASQPAPVEGTASDTLYTQAAWLLDYGLSYDVVLDMLDLHSPGYDRDDIATRVYNATKHRQNDIGAHAGQGMMVAALERWQAEHPEITAPAEPEKLQNKVVGWADIRSAVYPPVWFWWEHRCVGDDANLYTGRPKAGKTTLIENLAVAVCGGAALLNKKTRQGAVFMLVGEDRYGEVRDNLRQIRDALKVDDQALSAHLSLFSVRSDRVADGHRLANIADDGVVAHSRFLTEVVMPHLISLPKPCLWIIDPVAVFFGFNRYADAAARALVDGFLNEIVAMGITPLLTDHPSQASLEDGRNVAGSVQLAAAFPLVATLKADRWQGLVAVQRRMSFELMGSRYAPEGDGDCEFYRLKSTPAFSQAGAPGHSKRDHMVAVLRYVLKGLERTPAPLYCSDNNKGAADGPRGMAQMVGISEADTEKAIASCLSENWLQVIERTGGGGGDKGHTPRHLRLGSNAPRVDRLDAPASHGAAELW